MTQPTGASEAADARSREQVEADRTAAREQAARAQFVAQFEPESPDVSDLERRLRADATDLSDAAIANALRFGGWDPRKGLAGVPREKAHDVSVLLRSSFRTNLTT